MELYFAHYVLVGLHVNQQIPCLVHEKSCVSCDKLSGMTDDSHVL